MTFDDDVGEKKEWIRHKQTHKNDVYEFIDFGLCPNRLSSLTINKNDENHQGETTNDNDDDEYFDFVNQTQNPNTNQHQTNSIDLILIWIIFGHQTKKFQQQPLLYSIKKIHSVDVESDSI